MKYIQATISHRGGRKINEDSSGNLTHTDGGCFTVADGLGGHGGGDVASKIAVVTIVGAYQNNPECSSVRAGTLLELAQQAILLRQQEDSRLYRMRSTAVVLLLEDAKAWWAHVGDTRLYHLADGHIVHQTKDHSVPQVMVDAGDIAYEDIRHHEDRNRLTRSLGSDGKARTTVLKQAVVINDEDAFLLCTDGFWEFVTESDMEVTFAQSDTPGNWLAQMENILLHKVPADHDNYTATAIFLK